MLDTMADVMKAAYERGQIGTRDGNESPSQLKIIGGIGFTNTPLTFFYIHDTLYS